MRIVMHGHHAGTLFSHFNNEADVKARISYIKTDKPEDERELRLALLQDVTDLLPPTEAWDALSKARDACDKAWDALSKARDACDKARDAYDKARDAYYKARDVRDAYYKAWDADAFHAANCHPNCPWDGKTIFSKGTSIDVL